MQTKCTLLAELLEVLSRGKFSARPEQARLTPAGLVDDLRKLAVVVTPSVVSPVIANDADDDHVLAAALVGRVDLIVSDDKRHVLPLGSYRGIAIVTAREALDRLAARPRPV